jgi:hypothetical protein
MEKYLAKSNESVSERIGELRRRIEKELGGLSFIVDHVAGPALLWSARRDAAAYPIGRPLEPQTFVDHRHW